MLLGVERDVALTATGLAAARILVQQPLDELPLHERRFDDVVDVAQMDSRVEDPVRLDRHQRPHLAETLASAAGYVLERLTVRHFLFQLHDHRQTGRRNPLGQRPIDHEANRWPRNRFRHTRRCAACLAVCHCA